MACGFYMACPVTWKEVPSCLPPLEDSSCPSYSSCLPQHSPSLSSSYGEDGGCVVMASLCCGVFSQERSMAWHVPLLFFSSAAASCVAFPLYTALDKQLLYEGTGFSPSHSFLSLMQGSICIFSALRLLPAPALHALSKHQERWLCASCVALMHVIYKHAGDNLQRIWAVA